jgi:hypothetical protein
MCAIADFFRAIPLPIWSSVIGAIATIAAAALAASMIFVQIKRQLGNAIAQTRSNEAIKLKKDVYKEVLDVVDSLQNAETEAFSYTHKFEFGLINAETSLQFSGKAKPPEVCTEDLIEKHYDLSKKTSAFVGLIERWTIIDPRLVIFQTAINAVKFDVDLQFQRYFDISLKSMPRKFQLSPDPSIAKPEWQMPNAELRKLIEAESIRFRDVLMLIGNVVFDFKIEMQNLLLSELFESRAPYRKPIDPRIKVIKLEDHEALAKYFDNESAWGINKHEAIQRAKSQISGGSS